MAATTIFSLAVLLVTSCAGAPLSAPAAPAKPSAPAAPTTPARPVEPGPEWQPLRGLLGTWSGSDASGRGGFTLAPDLAGKVLIRRGTNDTAKEHHEDLTIIYHAATGDLQASYFDNEGHTIHYTVTAPDSAHVVFLSDELPGQPRFRLTYDASAAEALAIVFEIAPPGAPGFQPYVKGTVHRVAP